MGNRQLTLESQSSETNRFKDSESTAWAKFKELHYPALTTVPVEHVLEFMSFCLRKQFGFKAEEKLILVIGVDEIKKVGDYEALRKHLTNTMTHFYKQGNFVVRFAFTSFLPSDIVETTKSGREVDYVYLKRLPLEVIKGKLFKEHWEARDGNRRAILCCLGHQRALEVLSVVLKVERDPLKKSFPHKLGELTTDGLNEMIYFSQVMESVITRFVKYRVDWRDVEPVLTGRTVKLGEVIRMEGSKKYIDLFSEGVYINTPELPEDAKSKHETEQVRAMEEIEMQPLTNLFLFPDCLYLFR